MYQSTLTIQQMISIELFKHEVTERFVASRFDTETYFLFEPMANI
jgi:hypothetical protein